MKNLIFALLLSLVSITAFAQKTDIELITKTLTDYIDGSTKGQPNKLKSAFYKDLNLYYIKNDSIKIWSGKEYIDATKAGKPTGETGKIISINYENNAAVAKVEIAHPKAKKPYVDYFLLLKRKGKWIIIHKMFTKRD